MNMSRQKADGMIGVRAAEEVMARAGQEQTTKKCMEDCGIRRQRFWDWENGITPSITALQRLAFGGYDVNYILTGWRR